MPHFFSCWKYSRPLKGLKCKMREKCKMRKKDFFLMQPLGDGRMFGSVCLIITFISFNFQPTICHRGIKEASCIIQGEASNLEWHLCFPSLCGDWRAECQERLSGDRRLQCGGGIIHTSWQTRCRQLHWPQLQGWQNVVTGAPWPAWPPHSALKHWAHEVWPHQAEGGAAFAFGFWLASFSGMK